MKAKPDWECEGRTWPNRDASRFTKAAGMTWHVQIMGNGPVLLMLHGTGAATHTWRGLGPLLAKHFQVISLDLPGHGFTQAPPRDGYALPRMAAAIATLMAELKVSPDHVIGHSAGVAIAVRMVLDKSITPGTIVSLNGALMPFPGAASFLFPALAKLLLLNPFAAPLLAWRASSPLAVARLIKGTGSTLDAEGLDLYARLMRTERHIAAAIGMMANWDLRGLRGELPRLPVPLTLVAAERDRAVPPREANIVSAMVPSAKVVPVKTYGHLAHEEAPALFAEIIHQAIAA